MVVVILRPGKTPLGEEVRNLLRRLIGRIRRDWPDTRITIRGDGIMALAAEDHQARAYVGERPDETALKFQRGYYPTLRTLTGLCGSRGSAIE